jgi:hypothetical protein
MPLIDQDTIYDLNESAANNPDAIFGDSTHGIKGVLFTALSTYILPTAFFLIIAYGIWGAVQYFTAYGSDEKATKGKKTMTWAIVGAIVVASAFLIVRYVNYVIGASDVSSDLD